MAIKKILIIVLVSLGLYACTLPDLYSSYHAIDPQGWAIDSVQYFRFDIQDTSSTYQMLIHIRHNECYPYQNMWLIIEDTARHKCPNDTIEFYLADGRGSWLGNNHTGFLEMPILYESERTFSTPGTYYISIEQGMRDSILPGVLDVGLTVRKNGKE